VAIDAPLTFGQLSTWRSIETFDDDTLVAVNVPATWDVRGFDAATVRDALARLVDRHESLRTTYHIVNGAPVQRVHDELPPRIRYVDQPVADPADPQRTTAELYREPFPVTDDPAWHAVLVSVAGQPRFLALSLSHMVVDLWAVKELEAQFRALATGTGAEPVRVPQPRELAVRQRGETWEARRRRAEAYWLRLLTDGPVRNLPLPPAGRRRQTRIQATLRSHQLAVLVAEAAKALGTSQQSVLMAATAVALSRFIGRGRVMLSLMSANRFEPDWQTLISTQNQLVPLICEVDPAIAVGPYVKRAHFQAMLAYRNGSYDVDRAEELAKDVGPVNGDSFAHDCWFNYIAEAESEVPDSAPLATSAELTWDTPLRNAGHPFYARVHGDGRNWIAVTFRVDPDIVPAGQVVEALRTVARTVLRAATAPETPLGDLQADTPEPLATALFPAEYPTKD
jgi:hypothetical protein